jgi:hypothetical protein
VFPVKIADVFVTCTPVSREGDRQAKTFAVSREKTKKGEPTKAN